jgi:hypothetical protein
MWASKCQGWRVSEGAIYYKKNRDTSVAVFNVLSVREGNIVTALLPSPCAMRPAFYFTIIFLVTVSLPASTV